MMYQSILNWKSNPGKPSNPNHCNQQDFFSEGRSTPYMGYVGIWFLSRFGRKTGIDFVYFWFLIGDDVCALLLNWI